MLERSEKYVEKIEAVRRTDQADRTKEAQLLRMEAMLDNAKLTRQLIHFLEQHPDGDEAAFEQHAQESDLVVHPESVKRFIEELRTARAQVLAAVDQINKKAGKRRRHESGTSDPAAEELYSWLVSPKRVGYLSKFFSKNKPSGQVTLDTDYPLAVVLSVSKDEDLDALDMAENSVGFYGTAYSPISTRMFGRFTFPIIIVRKRYKLAFSSRDPRNYVTNHEKGHAEHGVFVKSLRSKKPFKKIVWVLFTGRRDSRKRRQKIVDAVEQCATKQDAATCPGYEWIMRYALKSAKKEILAHYKPEKNVHYVTQLTGTTVVYDYFEEIGIAKSSDLHKQLWKDYTQRLQSVRTTIESVIAAYSNDTYELSDRIDLFRWVLAQIPFDDLDKQLSGARPARPKLRDKEFPGYMFKEEAEALQQIYKDWQSFQQALRIDAKYGEPSEGAKRMERTYRAFFKELKEHQTEPLMPIIERFRAQNDEGHDDMIQ